MFDIELHSQSGDVDFSPLTLRDIVFSPLPHRSEDCFVIYSHIGDDFVKISLKDLRRISMAISETLQSLNLKRNDTILLASFSSTNELANALIFTAASCSGIRVFVPIFPEPSEFDGWLIKTGFKCVIMPYLEVLYRKGHEREKEVIALFREKCKDHNIPFLDSFRDFPVNELINKESESSEKTGQNQELPSVTPETEAVIFTTSGTSGISKLLVYSHQSLGNCCQAWQKAGLFSRDLFGNPGFSPLFTHTIGIRTFLNCVWSGNPFCIILTDWFLRKPEIVRLLLLKMNPGHIISGPAFFNTLIELFRMYPELKVKVNQSLRSAISIGAPYDETTALKFKSATGIRMMNGMGTTETLMVTLNIPERARNYQPESLGALLPGVVIGLKKSDEQSEYELFIRSPFQSVRTLGEKRPSEFFDSGDLVKYEESDDNLFFIGRRSSDFMKDEFGVKIPLEALHEYYNELYSKAAHIEWIPLVNIPGLAALVFLKKEENIRKLKDLSSLTKSINEELKRRIEPFEYTHRHLERLSIVNEDVPRTRKGTVSRDQIFKKYEQIISELRNPFVYSQFIEHTETGDKSNLNKFSNPFMSDLLEALKLDKVYVKASKDYLYYQKGEILQKVTDFVGGFGSNLLGHNNPEIRKAIRTFLASGYPALNNQGSLYYYPPLLARELNRIFSKATGRYFMIQFGNSGTEATEIAIHHAYFEWRSAIEKLRDEQLQLFGSDSELNAAEIWDRNMRTFEAAVPSIIVVNNCFHGYTSGARSLLGMKKQRFFFSGLLKPKSLHISDNENGLENKIENLARENFIELDAIRSQNGSLICEPLRISSIIASIIEPVRGEGGIHVTNHLLIEILAKQSFPLISDEIQCGLGRTGLLPSCPVASYYLLGKSLGGGMEKISAVLIDDQRFKPTFSKYFTSTFANGEMAAFCGLETLKIIESNNLPCLAREKGDRFISLLRKTASQFPDIIESVEGKGLIIGIHFSQTLGSSDNILRILAENELLGYLFAGWLLNNRNIRVLPSLSSPNSIRIEPSFYLPDKEMKALCKALGEICNICRVKKMYDLFRFLMNDDPYPDKLNPVFKGVFPQVIEPPADGSIRAGFIGNFTQPHRELQVMEPDFCRASDTGLRILFNRIQVLLEGKPFRIISKNLMGGKAHFTFYILPFDTSQMEVIGRWGKKRFYISKIQEAVDKLTREGVSCISLGAHTSIVSGNGLNIAERNGCKVLTGNTLTVASAVYHLNKHLKELSQDGPKPLTIAIVGASGNIGSGIVGCLADPAYSGYHLLLLGNNEKRLKNQKERLSGTVNQVTCSSDLFKLDTADIILCCVNTNDPVIFPHHLNTRKKVFIIDISVPSALSERVRSMKNVALCDEASSVYLENENDLLISSHTPPGKIFCCAGESILCALYKLQVPLKGHIDRSAVMKLIELGVKENLYEK